MVSLTLMFWVDGEKKLFPAVTVKVAARAAGASAAARTAIVSSFFMLKPSGPGEAGLRSLIGLLRATIAQSPGDFNPECARGAHSRSRAPRRLFSHRSETGAPPA